MTIKFVKAHKTPDGRTFTVGQITVVADENLAKELIRQGIAQQQPAGSETTEETPPAATS